MTRIRDALNDFLVSIKPGPQTRKSRLKLVNAVFREREFPRKEYLQCFKAISTATASYRF